ncbi:hypothetical protein GCM10027615_51380 [Plantactinospora veratri]
MSTTTAGILLVAALAAVLVAAYRPFGDYLYRVVTGTRHSRVERGIYRLIGVDAQAEQSWGTYARSVLAFSLLSSSSSTPSCGCRTGSGSRSASTRYRTTSPGTPRSAS